MSLSSKLTKITASLALGTALLVGGLQSSSAEPSQMDTFKAQASFLVSNSDGKYSAISNYTETTDDIGNVILSTIANLSRSDVNSAQIVTAIKFSLLGGLPPQNCKDNGQELLCYIPNVNEFIKKIDKNAANKFDNYEKNPILPYDSNGPLIFGVALNLEHGQFGVFALTRFRDPSIAKIIYNAYNLTSPTPVDITVIGN